MARLSKSIEEQVKRIKKRKNLHNAVGKIQKNKKVTKTARPHGHPSSSTQVAHPAQYGGGLGTRRRKQHSPQHVAPEKQPRVDEAGADTDNEPQDGQLFR